MALVDRGAALYVRDADAKEQLLPLAITTAKDTAMLKQLAENAKAMGLPDSANIIAKEVIKLTEK